jgi:hypothetical protein
MHRHRAGILQQHKRSSMLLLRSTRAATTGVACRVMHVMAAVSP